jgi:L,D-transpeptidase catalytic domain
MKMSQSLGLRVRLRTAVLVTAVLTAGFGTPAITAALPAREASIESVEWIESRTAAGDGSVFDPGAWAASEVGGIDADVLKLAFAASQCAARSGAVRRPSTLTVIDYSKPSTEPRLWVLDLETRELLYEELVAHGQGSGDNFARKFSNDPESHQTSLGLFRTDTTYVGRNGYSLRLDGLDQGYNDRARERAIVMHGAPYVNAETAKTLGRLGRSHGCPAVRNAVARELIDRVKGDGLLFAYYPDRNWLNNSKYLNACGA